MSHATVDLDRLIAAGALRTYLQPIVSVRRKELAGLESLLRAHDPETGQCISPTVLFHAAAEQNKTHVLDRVARNLTLRLFAQRRLHEECLLFLNADLDSILHGDAFDEFLHTIKALDIPASSIVLELVENQFDDAKRLESFVSRLREHGILLAVDDIGAGHSNLERISLIRPDVLKIDRSLCSKLGQDLCTGEVFSSIARLGRRIGALVVAEGIENHTQAMAALEKGAEMLQGFLIMKPQPGDTIDLAQVRADTAMLSEYFRQHMLTKINRAKVERRKNNMLLDAVLCEISLTEPHEFETTLARCLPTHAAAECAYVLDHLGLQVTPAVFANTLPNTSMLFSPPDIGVDHALRSYYHNLFDGEHNRFSSEQYISLASGRPCRTVSSTFRDVNNERTFVLCIEVYSG